MTAEKHEPGRLKDLPPDKVLRNPENPRLFFRPEEMDTLMASIRRYGIQVPITVYEDGEHYVLIDGERRWRCAKKLNLRRIPALVQAKPTRFDNILLMFNIHALREQWDYLTIANKIPDIIEYFKKDNQGREPNEQELSELTGLTRGQIRRCRLLFDLPRKYRSMLETELELPKSRQNLSEDFFIEMERALKTVEKRLPSVIPEKDKVRDVLIDKFRNKIINNITDFRKLSKIATSIRNLGIQEARATSAVRDIFSDNTKIGIDEIYSAHFEIRYDERKIGLQIESIYEFLDSRQDEGEPIAGDIRSKLLHLRDAIDRVLED